MAECTVGCAADQWCSRGEAHLVLEGELAIGLRNGESRTFGSGVNSQAANNTIPHRSYTTGGEKLFIVD